MTILLTIFTLGVLLSTLMIIFEYKIYTRAEDTGTKELKVIINTWILIWITGALLSSQWIVAVLVFITIVLRVSIHKLIRVKKSAFSTLIMNTIYYLAALFMLLNMYHLHINLFELIKSLI